MVIHRDFIDNESVKPSGIDTTDLDICSQLIAYGNSNSLSSILLYAGDGERKDCQQIDSNDRPYRDFKDIFQYLHWQYVLTTGQKLTNRDCKMFSFNMFEPQNYIKKL